MAVVLSVLALGFASAMPSKAQVGNVPTDEQLLAAWDYANSKCQGSSDPKVYERACQQRGELEVKLAKRGFCYGKKTDKAGYEANWHRCTPESCGIVEC